MNNIKETSSSIKAVMDGLNQRIESGALDVKETLVPLQSTLTDLQLLMTETRDLVTELKESPSDILFKSQTVAPAPNEH